jgi:hypothetical protein
VGKHISFLSDEEKELEKRVLAEYSRCEVRRHLELFTTLTRISGTDDELKAACYIDKKLNEYRVDSDIYEFDAYISYPRKAEFEVLFPVRKSFPCLTQAFVASTPPEGIEAELISLGRGLKKDYQGVDVRAKIVLLEPGGGVAQVIAAQTAEKNRAAAQVHINSGSPRAISIMQLRNTWGSPTWETIDNVLQRPAIGISNQDGIYLTELTRKNRVKVRLKVDAWCGYKTVRQPIGTLMGEKEPKKYILFGAHYCSWFKGATDNAVANSLMLEMARIFSKYRKNLNRSIRFAWWTGHTQGTFAGSTWYLDNYWDDIRKNAIVYLNMDGVGRTGSSGFEARNTEEIRKFHELVIRQVLGIEVKSRRVSKIGDQSFWGIGLPSFTGRTDLTVNQTSSAKRNIEWYRHTKEDTLDKVDMEQIVPTFRVNAISICRLCNNPILPFEFTTVAEAIKIRLNELQKVNQASLDLTSLINEVDAMKEKTQALNGSIEKSISTYKRASNRIRVDPKFKKINICLMELSRILIPALYSRAGKYGQDQMGSKFKPIPLLQPLEDMNSMDKNSYEYKALRTSLVRERNKISDTLNSANRFLDDTLNSLERS